MKPIQIIPHREAPFDDRDVPGPTNSGCLWFVICALTFTVLVALGIMWMIL